ncbi:ACP S-malonyltransferase [Solwaraspora sp. WMMD406]|uniref:ACP S-malonyltransferase n=1 Tax=Solwaraspora sp. WMMD406 TaxID=3016095 RepID=UPI0024178BC7|nr:ACP S-malonyltransferase [Solwaraspora sp. WMMD406]MDG4765625.1 ACP S-malonyltransferase [Solwaraspora sp. WMMD406]
MLAFLFPGQGTLRVGMGGWLRRHPAAASVFEQADAILEMPISRLCARGPVDDLVATEHAQPAVTVCNLAALAVLRAEGHAPDIVAGHSVGELSALYAADVLDLATTLRLVRVRARLMAEVSGTGAMAAVLGVPLPQVQRLVETVSSDAEPLTVGLVNAPDHVVVSGAAPAVDRFRQSLGATGKLAPLKVSNAFHSPLMAEALGEWERVVRDQPMRTPTVPVVPNVTATPTTDAEVLRESVISQLVGRVRWAETMRRLPADATCVEVGDSRALAGFARGAGLRCLSLSDPASVRRLAGAVTA